MQWVVALDFMLQYSPMCIDHPWRSVTRPAFHWWTSSSSLPEVSKTVSIIHSVSFCMWLRQWHATHICVALILVDCFFSFAEEITLFAFFLLFLYSFHASFMFSFLHFSYFIFFSLTASATSSFHHNLSFHICSVLFSSLYFSSVASVHLHPGLSILLPIPSLWPCSCTPHVSFPP